MAMMETTAREVNDNDDNDENDDNEHNMIVTIIMNGSSRVVEELKWKNTPLCLYSSKETFQTFS